MQVNVYAYCMVPIVYCKICYYAFCLDCFLLRLWSFWTCFSVDHTLQSLNWDQLKPSSNWYKRLPSAIVDGEFFVFLELLVYIPLNWWHKRYKERSCCNYSVGQLVTLDSIEMRLFAVLPGKPPRLRVLSSSLSYNCPVSIDRRQAP